jgi:polyhydroxybutyrate depolymerase
VGNAPPLRSALFTACLTALALTACGHAAPATQPTARAARARQGSIRVQGMTRTYLLDAPRTNKPLPLVLVYHGDNQTAAETAQGDWRGDAVQQHEIVVFMQGVDDSWNPGIPGSAAARAGVDDVAFTQAVIRRVEADHNVDRSRVAAAGFSDGAFLTQLLGCRLADEIDLIVPMEGELPTSISSTCRPPRPVSVYEVHAAADPVVSYNGGHVDGDPGAPTLLSAPASAARWAAIDGCTHEPSSSRRGGSSLRTWTGCAQGTRVTLDTTSLTRHDWAPDPGAIVAAAVRRLG